MLVFLHRLYSSSIRRNNYNSYNYYYYNDVGIGTLGKILDQQ